MALNFPTRAALGATVGRLRAAGWPLRSSVDHGTHEAVYLSDPDGNDLELAWDRPADQWPRDDQGNIVMAMGDPLDLEALVAEGSAG